MPYRDRNRKRRSDRNSWRKRYHGWDWRGIIEYYGRTCANTSNPELDGLCMEIESLELHEPFGEDKRRAVNADFQQGYMQQRILLCRQCHRAEHQAHLFPLDRGLESLYLQDTDDEIIELGSMQAWYDKYRVGESLGMGLVSK